MCNAAVIRHGRVWHPAWYLCAGVAWSLDTHSRLRSVASPSVESSASIRGVPGTSVHCQSCTMAGRCDLNATGSRNRESCEWQLVGWAGGYRAPARWQLLFDNENETPEFGVHLANG